MYRNLYGVALLIAAATATPVLAQAVGVDGQLGAEWTGVLPKSIPAAPYGQPGVGTEYDVYTRADLNYVYTLVKANPAGEGNDNWTATVAAQLGNVVNLGFDVDPPPVNTNGSDLVVETENNRYATFNPDTSVSYVPYNALNGIVQASTAVRDYSDPNPGFSVELAIPWSFFETDPDGTGNLPPVGPLNPDIVVRYSQSFDGTFDLQGPQFSATRFGEYTDPNFVPEPASLGAIIVAGGGLLARRRRRAQA